MGLTLASSKYHKGHELPYIILLVLAFRSRHHSQLVAVSCTVDSVTEVVSVVLCRIVKDDRFERLPCLHAGTYADDCLVQRVTQVM